MFEQGANDDGVALRNVYVKHEPVMLDCSHDGRTRQEFAEECDINVLLARYEKSGALNHYNSAEPAYFDVSEAVDLQTAHEIMQNAERAFMTLPAAVRREFDHDALQFVSWLQVPDGDKDAYDKKLAFLREHKLAAPAPVEPAPVKVEVMNPPAADK